MNVILKQLCQLITDFDGLCTVAPLSSDSVSHKTILEKHAFIKNIEDISAQLGVFGQKLAVISARAKTARDSEIKYVDMLHAATHAPESIATLKQFDADMRATPRAPGPAEIALTPSIAIGAIVVRSFDDVKANGSMYFVESANHFAFKINGALFHGNVGVIYSDEKQPLKIKNCQYKGNCGKKDRCDYYHDPLHHPGSKDVRNYVNSSFAYTGAGVRKKFIGAGRKLGNRDTLDVDTSTCTEEDMSKYRDQVVHDILCLLAGGLRPT